MDDWLPAPGSAAILPGDRVPEHLPYLVHTSRRKFYGWFGGLGFGLLLVSCALCTGLMLASLEPGAAPIVAALAVAAVICVLVIAALLVALHHRHLGRGPILGANSEGICVRQDFRSATVYWLPWREVASVHATRIGLGNPALCVVARRALFQVVSPGTVVVYTWLADQAAREIATALAQFAAGRTEIQP